MRITKSTHELERVRRVYQLRDARDYGDRYTHFNAGNLFAIQEREKLLLKILRQTGCYPLSQRDIFEVGCGNGFWLRQFVHWGADPGRICGIELDPTRANEARRLCPESVRIVISDAGAIPLRSSSFDLVLQSTVFTSMLDEDLRRAAASEMVRLLKPKGLVLWYDFRFNNPRNQEVRGIPRSEVRKLFPGCRVEFHSVTLAPFLARAVAPISGWMCRVMNAVPMLRTHLLAVITRAF